MTTSFFNAKNENTVADSKATSTKPITVKDSCYSCEVEDKLKFFLLENIAPMSAWMWFEINNQAVHEHKTSLPAEDVDQVLEAMKGGKNVLWTKLIALGANDFVKAMNSAISKTNPALKIAR